MRRTGVIVCLGFLLPLFIHVNSMSSSVSVISDIFLLVINFYVPILLTFIGKWYTVVCEHWSFNGSGRKIVVCN